MVNVNAGEVAGTRAMCLLACLLACFADAGWASGSVARVHFFISGSSYVVRGRCRVSVLGDELKGCMACMALCCVFYFQIEIWFGHVYKSWL